MKKDIDVLNARITCVEYDNDKFKKENQEFKKRIIFLENENQELRKRIDILEFNKIKKKIITALLELMKNLNIN